MCTACTALHCPIEYHTHKETNWLAVNELCMLTTHRQVEVAQLLGKEAMQLSSVIATVLCVIKDEVVCDTVYARKLIDSYRQRGRTEAPK